MQNTEHLNLNLPEATDPYDIGNENENMEILDSAIYNHGIILGTTSAAGHVKTINDLTKTSLTNGEALSARMGNALGQMMAPIVTGPNYPSSITKKGDQFVYNGRLCVVTANTVSTSTAINIGSSGNANYASPITSQISDLGSSVNLKASGAVCTHITSSNHPNVSVNILCDSSLVTTFLLFSDVYGNVFITHFPLNENVPSLTEITNSPSLVTWLAKPSNNAHIYYASDGAYLRIKIMYSNGSGTPVISITQLDNSTATVVISYGYGQS